MTAVIEQAVRQTYPTVFLSYQQELLATVAQEAVTVVEKSRRTGYSWAMAMDAVLTAAARREAGGMDVLYMGYNLEMAREFIDYVAEWSRHLLPAALEVQDHIFTDPEHPEKQIKAFRVEFASGFKVLALPSVPRALRGMQGKVIIDEAAFHDDLKELLKSAFALLIWGGKVVVVSTHNGDTNPFAELVNDIRAGRLPYKLLRCTFDDALADGLYRRVCLTSGKEWTAEGEVAWRSEIIAQYGAAADEELFAIPSATGGAYLPGPLIERQMVDRGVVLRWECDASFVHLPAAVREAECQRWIEAEVVPLLAMLDPNEPHAFGQDFGRVRDLSAGTVLAIGADLVRRARLAWELRNVPFDQQRQILHSILDRLPRLRAGIMDAGGNGAYLAEVTMQRYGSIILPLMMNETWYRENMPPLKAAFEDGTIELTRDRETLEDLRMIELVRGVPRVPDRRRDDRGGKRHGDAAIGVVLAYAASRMDPEIYGYEPALRNGPRLGSVFMSMQARDEAEDMAQARGGRGELQGFA